MNIFCRVARLAPVFIFCFALSAQAVEIYDKEFVRGFLSLKFDPLRSMKSNGINVINDVTGKSYKKNYMSGHVDIGAEYKRLHTWFDIDFMPVTQTRKPTEWFQYGATWMFGYKLLPENFTFNMIPSIGPGISLLNVRLDQNSRIYSSLGRALNLEMEFRIQFSQFSFGAYGGYKVVRHDEWDDLTQRQPNPTVNNFEEIVDVNADQVFVGIKFTWTMLSAFQKRQMELNGKIN